MRIAKPERGRTPRTCREAEVSRLGLASKRYGNPIPSSFVFRFLVAQECRCVFSCIFSLLLERGEPEEESSRAQSRERRASLSLYRARNPTDLAPPLHNLRVILTGGQRENRERGFPSASSSKSSNPFTKMSAQQPQDYSEAWRQYYAAHAAYAAQHLGGGARQVRRRR